MTPKEDRVPQQDSSRTDQGDVETQLDALGLRLPACTLGEAVPEERAALLDLARIAAHRSQRWAAPISTYLVGLAFASLPRAERLERIHALVAQLDVDVEQLSVVAGDADVEDGEPNRRRLAYRADPSVTARQARGVIPRPRRGQLWAATE